MMLANAYRFVRACVTDPLTMGCISPSSSRLAAALTMPFRNRTAPARVLEVGAGTGSVTRLIARHFGDDDRLDICEINGAFVRMLESKVLSVGSLARARREDRVRLLHCPVQDIDETDHYDFVISGLPLNLFHRDEIKSVLAVIRRSLRPGGIFSYFEYVGLRRLGTLIAGRGRRKRMRSISTLLNKQIRNYEFDRQTVLRNLPPAHARHWRFTPTRSDAVPPAADFDRTAYQLNGAML